LINQASKINLDDYAILKINEIKRDLVRKNHSSEHLLQRALKTLISDSIKQEGAFKSPQKLSFDFQYHQKLTNEQLDQIEVKVNEYIKSNTTVETILTDLATAKQMGAIGYFEDVYEKIKGKLRVVKMGDIETELCGGTHVHNLNEIEQFKIIKYYSKGGGS